MTVWLLNRVQNIVVKGRQTCSFLCFHKSSAAEALESVYTRERFNAFLFTCTLLISDMHMQIYAFHSIRSKPFNKFKTMCVYKYIQCVSFITDINFLGCNIRSHWHNFIFYLSLRLKQFEIPLNISGKDLKTCLNSTQMLTNSWKFSVKNENIF